MAGDLQIEDHHVTDTNDDSPVSLAQSGSRSELAVSIAASCLAATLVALTITRWRQIFTGSSIVVLLIAACLVGLVAAVVTRALKYPMVVGAAAGVVSLTVVCAAVSPSEIASIPAALVTGWKRLATEGLLMTPSVGLVVPPVMVCGLGSFAGAWLAFDAKQRGRAIIVGLTTVAVSLLYTVDVTTPGLWFGVGVALCIGLILAADAAVLPAGISFAASEATEGHARRSALLAGSAVAAIVVVAALLSSLLDGAGLRATPLALRDELQRPITTVEESTPLAGVKAGLVVDRPSAVFSFSTDGLDDDQTITYLPVATLESYDGAVFGSGGTFTPAGSVLPGQSDEPLVVQRVTFAPSYPFRSLPRAGSVHRLNTNDLLWNEETGTIAALDPIDGFEASIVASDVTLSPESTLGAVPTDFWAATELPTNADIQLAVLDRFIAATVTAPVGSVDALLELEAALRSDDFGYNENAPGGHSLAAIASYLEPTEGERASRIGFAEQSATAFALLSRRIGVPARVVVGYELDEPLTSTSGVVNVTEDMIHAWPEVWTDQGWARAEPTNKDNAVTDADPRQPVTSSDSDRGEIAPLDDIAPPLLAPELTEPAPASSRSLRWLWLLAFAGLIGAVIIAKRARTQRRRNQSDPNQRAIAAWAELRDRLDDLGHPTAGHESTDDLGDRLTIIDLRAEANELYALGPMLDDALYSPTGTDAERADEAWGRVDSILGGVRSASGRSQRAKAAIDPRTLIRR